MSHETDRIIEEVTDIIADGVREHGLDRRRLKAFLSDFAEAIAQNVMARIKKEIPGTEGASPRPEPASGEGPKT